MAASQEHGLIVENIILDDMFKRNQNWLPATWKTLPKEEAHTARFDAPGYLDPNRQGIPTSIKTAKSQRGQALVCLADANRIADLGNFKMTRLLVALYDQVGDQKVVREVREYLITGDEWRVLMGQADQDLIEAFSNDIKIKDSQQARERARQWKRAMSEAYPSLLKWNPKIDSKNQRRLQCSVHLKDLESVIQDKSRIRVYGNPKIIKGQVRPLYLQPKCKRLWKDGPYFPIVLESALRQRHKNKNTQPTTTTSSPRSKRGMR